MEKLEYEYICNSRLLKNISFIHKTHHFVFGNYNCKQLLSSTGPYHSINLRTKYYTKYTIQKYDLYKGRTWLRFYTYYIFQKDFENKYNQ